MLRLRSHSPLTTRTYYATDRLGGPKPQKKERTSILDSKVPVKKAAGDDGKPRGGWNHTLFFDHLALGMGHLVIGVDLNFNSTGES